MRHIHRLTYLASFLFAFVCTVLGFAIAAPAAFAMQIPAPGGSSAVAPTSPSPIFTRTVVASGMPGWQIAIVVVVVAVLAATIAIIVDRARAAGRIGIVTAS